MADIRTDAVSSLPEPLTDREREILACLVGGLSNQEIASRLHLALRTVKWYNSQIYSKLGVSNRKEAIEQTEAVGLLDAPNDGALTVQVRHNLPVQTTAFVGRQRELHQLAQMLSNSTIHLLTILAPGGMGKTRLGLAAAEAQLKHFTDGVFFVPLAPLTSPENIVTAIAESVGFSFYGSEPPEQQLLNYFGQRKTLLVLDNFEHLLDGAPLVAHLLQGAPDLIILTTSREKLNLSAETVFTITGLQFPNWETPEDALTYDAVKLFIQSAHRVRPDFALHTDNLDFLARICRLTAGMPLALVLAAGWLDVLTLEQIATEIQKGIDILETELRDMPERQRSIRATFNYSWTRLSEAERDVLMKLSVFRDGFTAEAAQAVAGAGIHTLRKLVDKAMAQMRPGGRYDIHELLRQFGEEKLRAIPDEKETVQARHCAYYAEYLYQRRDDSKNHKQVQFMVEVEAEIENVRAAWETAIERSDFDAIGNSTESLYRFYREKAWYLQGKNEFEATAQALRTGPRSRASEHVAAQLLARVAVMQGMKGDFDRALQQATESLDILDRLGSRRQPFTSLEALARTSLTLGRFAEGTAYVAAAYAVAQENGDKWGMAIALGGQAIILRMQSRFEESRREFLENMGLFVEIGDRWGVGWWLGEIGNICRTLGDYGEAERHVRESDRLAQETRSIPVRIHALENLGHIAWALGRLDEAEQFYDDVLTFSQDAGAVSHQAAAFQGLGNVARLLGNYGAAAQSLEHGLKLAKSMSTGREAAVILVDLGQVAYDTGEHISAYQKYQDGLALCQDAGWRWGIAYTLSRLGQAASALNKDEEAVMWFREALSVAHEIDVKPVLLDTLVRVAEHLCKRHAAQHGVELLVVSQHHPASTYETKLRAKTLLRKLEAESSVYKASYEPILELDVVVRDTLNELVK